MSVPSSGGKSPMPPAAPRPGPAPPPAGPPAQPPAGPQPPGRADHLAPADRLVRVEQGRVVAGVAGGVGAYLRLDPRVVRVVFVLATIFGGVGVLAYAAAWLVLPNASQPDSVGERLLRRFSRAPTVVQVLVVGWVVLIFGGRPGSGWGVALIVLGFLLLRLDTRSQQPRPAVPPSPVAPAVPPRPLPVAERSGAGTYGSYGVARGAAPAPLAGGGMSRRPAAPPSYLGRLTMASTVAVLGGAALLDAPGLVDLPPILYVSLALGTIGLGLLVGARVGRARWLVPTGLLLVPVLALLAAAPFLPRLLQPAEDVVALTGGVGDLRAAPAALPEVRDRYRLAAGSLLVDLSDVTFTGQPTRVAVQLGYGDATVIVPDDARVELTGQVLGGTTAVLGTEVEDTGVADLGKLPVERGPEDGGRLWLDVHVGGEQVEVIRATDHREVGP